MSHSWVERTRGWPQFWSIIVPFHAIELLLLSIGHRNVRQFNLNIHFFEFMSIFGGPFLALHDLIRVHFTQILWVIVSSANQKCRFLIDFFTKVSIDLYRLAQRIWFSFRLFYSGLEWIISSSVTIVDHSYQTWIQIAISAVILLVEKDAANIQLDISWIESIDLVLPPIILLAMSWLIALISANTTSFKLKGVLVGRIEGAAFQIWNCSWNFSNIFQ